MKKTGFVLIILVLMSFGCAQISQTVRPEVKKAFVEETKWIKLLQQMGDAYWKDKNFKSGFAACIIRYHDVNAQLRLVTEEMVARADQKAETFQKGYELALWMHFLWYGSQEVQARVVPPVVEWLVQFGVIGGL
jgi:hypothetical protein